MISKIPGIALALTLAAALGACGGGGSDSSDGASSGSTTTGGTGSTGSTSTTSSGTGLVTTAPATTYASGSAEATAFALVNSSRLACGFGALTQNASLDTAASNHATYLVDRLEEGVVAGHTEDSTLSGYTAATAAQRATLAGYYWSVISEDLAYYSPNANYRTGLVRSLFATVYHLASMVDGSRDAGISIKVAPSGTQYAVMEWLSGTASTAQQQQTTSLVTYPCDGSTGVQPYMGTESPEPFTNLGFTSGSSVGQPLYFKAPKGSTIVLTAASLTAASGTAITTTLYHYTDDPQGELAANQAFVIPRSALSLGTTYTASVTGTVDGTAFTRTFSFSTEASW